MLVSQGFDYDENDTRSENKVSCTSYAQDGNKLKLYQSAVLQDLVGVRRGGGGGPLGRMQAVQVRVRTRGVC